MYPNLFGINNFSYTLCIIIGIILAFVIACLYFKKQNLHKNAVIDLLICGCFSIALGFIFAILFENLYEIIALREKYKWTFKMTFFGGLFGGVVGFLSTYFMLKKKSYINFELIDVLKIAPVSILVAHGFGRIGCFFAGCCYGIKTDSWIGINFPNIGKVIPTQLIEAIILFVLFIITAILAFKTDFKYNVLIYALCYGTARFIIEFYRGDERGVLFALSPSQIWSLILIMSAVPIYLLMKKAENDKR